MSTWTRVLKAYKMDKIRWEFWIKCFKSFLFIQAIWKNYSIFNSFKPKVSTILTFIISSDKGVWMDLNLQNTHYSYNHPIGTHNLLWYADNSGYCHGHHLVGPVANRKIPLDQNFAPRPIFLPEMKEQTEFQPEKFKKNILFSFNFFGQNSVWRTRTFN